MSNRLLLKSSGTADAVPDFDDLELAELVVNTRNGKMFCKTYDGATYAIVDLTLSSPDEIIASGPGILGRTTSGSGPAALLSGADAAAMIPAATASVDGKMTKEQAAAVVATTEGSYAGGFGAVSNLRMKNSATNPTYQVVINAGGVTVRNGSKLLQLFDVSLTISITESGANGLDTGAEAANSWYYIWVIYNLSTATIAGLLSASSTNPVMPSGYTYKSMVGAVRNDASSNFVVFSQTNEEFSYSARRARSGTVSNNSYSLISIDDIVPASSGMIKSVLFGVTSTGEMAVYFSTDGTNAKTIATTGSTNNAIGVWNELYNFTYAPPVFIPVLNNGIYYKQASTGDTTIYARAFRWSHI
jgi:hypothetical protein